MDHEKFGSQVVLSPENLCVKKEFIEKKSVRKIIWFQTNLRLNQNLG